MFTEGEPPNVRVAVQSEKTYIEESIKLIKDPGMKSDATKLQKAIEGYLAKMKKLDAKGKNKTSAEKEETRKLSMELDTAFRDLSDIFSKAGILEKGIKGAGDGTRDKPYGLRWQKRRLTRYESFWLAPKDKVKGRTSQKKIKQIVGENKDYEYSPTQPKKVPGGGAMIGVSLMFQTREGLVVGPKKPKGAGRSENEKRRFNDLLEAHGYDRGELQTDGDHVVELQVSGPDAFPNLWPLDSSENRAGGASLKHQWVTIEDGSQKKVEDLDGKFFKITKFDVS